MTALALPVALAALAALAVHAFARIAHPALARTPARWVPSALAVLLAVGAALATAVVLPVHESGCHCHADAASVVHFCADHRERAAPLLLPSLLVLAVLLVRPARALARLARTSRAARRAMAASSPLAGADDRLILTELPLRNAFAVTVRGGRIIAGRAWWMGLADWERRAVLAHEQAHLKRRGADRPT